MGPAWEKGSELDKSGIKAEVTACAKGQRRAQGLEGGLALPSRENVTQGG